MKNHILNITRNTIPYVGKLRSIAGSVTSSILMQQLDYWFSKYPDGFYKFLEPCKHPSYVEGDSWCEELDFSAEETRTAFKNIGVSYKSKTEFLAYPGDKFQGKFYASYYNRDKGQVIYLRNHELVDRALDELIQNQVKTEQLRNKESILPETNDPGLWMDKVYRKPRTMVYRKPTTPVCIYKDTEITNSEINSNTQLPVPVAAREDREREKDNHLKFISKDMLQVWDQTFRRGSNYPTELTLEREQRLIFAYRQFFHDPTLQSWIKFCRKITSSKFLMGETKDEFRAKIDWVLNPEKIKKILEDAYTCGDRDIPIEQDPIHQWAEKRFNSLAQEEIESLKDEYFEKDISNSPNFGWMSREDLDSPGFDANNRFKHWVIMRFKQGNTEIPIARKLLSSPPDDTLTPDAFRKMISAMPVLPTVQKKVEKPEAKGLYSEKSIGKLVDQCIAQNRQRMLQRREVA